MLRVILAALMPLSLELDVTIEVRATNPVRFPCAIGNAV
jgi:hypothetical protein